jgi:hypothetical protein
LDNVTSQTADISQLDISQAELQAAENWIRGTPTRASLSPDVTMQADALVVGLKIVSAYPAERTRSGIIRELMPGISVAKLGRFVVLVDDHIQNALLSKTAQQQFELDDLKTVDEILRQLDGRPVDDTTSNEDMACLLRCFRHFDGYNPLASALTKAHSQRVDPRWVATAVNSAKQLLARRELSRLSANTSTKSQQEEERDSSAPSILSKQAGKDGPDLNVINSLDERSKFTQAFLSTTRISRSEMESAIARLMDTPIESLRIRGFAIKKSAYRVTLGIIAVVQPNQVRIVSRRLMPDVQPAKLSACRTRSEERLIRKFLLPWQDQACDRSQDLKRAVALLQQLHGEPAEESTSDTGMACLLRCYQHFNQCSLLIKAIRNKFGPCVQQNWILPAVNSIIHVLARRELIRFDLISQRKASHQAHSTQAKRSHRESLHGDTDQQPSSKRTPVCPEFHVREETSHDLSMPTCAHVEG